MFRCLKAIFLPLVIVLVEALCMPASLLAADTYPSKQVDLVIPWPPGGRTDVAVRLIGPYLAKSLGQPVVIQNKVGGAGLVAMTALRDATPDGYTISSGGPALASIQYQKKGAPTLWDYTWIARTYRSPLVVAVPTTSQFKNLKELVDFARANPGKVTHANSGTGSSTHLASEDFANRIGIKIRQVPYKGEGPATVGLAGGETAFALGLMPAFKTLLDAGKLRILGVADTKRNSLYAEVPTLSEQGIDFVSTAFEALHMPKGASPEVLSKLRAAAKQALTDPALKQKMAAIGLNLDYQDAPEFVDWLKRYDQETKTLITDLGMFQKD